MKSASSKLRLMAVSLLLCAAPLIAVAQDMPAGAWAGTWVANTAKCKFPGPPTHLGPGHHPAGWISRRPRSEC